MVCVLNPKNVQEEKDEEESMEVNVIDIMDDPGVDQRKLDEGKGSYYHLIKPSGREAYE